MGNLTHTVSGELASFRSAARVPIESLKCHFKPKQDLHGYDRPWPGGTGKNLLKISADNMVGNVSLEDKITITETGFNFNQSCICGFWVNVKPNTTYTYSYTSTYNGSEMHARVYESSEKTDTFHYDNMIINKTSWSGSTTFTTSENTNWLIVGAYAYGNGLNSSLTNMQLEEGSAATSYEPYENICPIEGWTDINITKTNKNIARITGYGTQNGNSVNSGFSLTNSYGTTINTTSFIMPDSPMIVTQSKWPNTSTIHSYTNGYITVFVDNLQFNNYYDVSFKISNVTNNPLNVSLSSIQLLVPAGYSYSPSKIVGNILIYKNIKWRPYAYNTNRSNFEIRNCGMSFTLSEFMVTPTGMNDGIFEPYCGKQIPITFPNISKNLFELTSFNYTEWSTNGYALSPIIDVENNTVTLNCQGQGDTQLYNMKNIYYPGTYTLSFDMNYISTQTLYKRMIIKCYDNNNQLMNNTNLTIDNFTYNQWYKGWFAIPQSFTVPNNVNYFTLGIGCGNDKKGDTVTISNIQLEYGENATTYEPYSFNNTVYGGYIDIAKGELIAEWMIDTTNNQTWNLSSDKNIYGYAYQWGHVAGKGYSATERPNSLQDGFSTHCLNMSLSSNDNGRYIGVNQNGALVLGNRFWERMGYDVTTLTSQDIVNFFNEQYEKGTPFYVCYPLKDPIHYPLSKIELKTFLDQNNIWSDTNDITEVSYQIHDSNIIQAARKNIYANIPHIETLNGNLISFNTDLGNKPLTACKVNFNSMQKGTGDPAPDNIREIIGWNKITVYTIPDTGYNITPLPNNYTSFNLHVTVDSNGVLYAEGTPTSYSTISFGTIPVQGNEILFGQQIGSLNNNIWNAPTLYNSNNSQISTSMSDSALNTGLDLNNYEDVKYIRVIFKRDNNNTYTIGYAYPIISKDSKVTIPRYTINWSNSIETLYGGYVDFINGKIIQTHKSITLNGSEEWSDYKTSQQMHFALSIPDKKSGLGTSISSIFPNVKNNSFWDYELYSQYGDHNSLKRIYVNAPYKMPDLVPEWKAWLAEHPMQLVYELETPIEYNIDPQIVKTLYGNNKIWSNANGNIEVQYWTH